MSQSRVRRRVVQVLCLSALMALAPLPAAPHIAETWPAHVLIIRHAEKPLEDEESVHLSPAGLARARALRGLFTSSATRPAPFPTPDFIFAAENTKNSHRPLETVEPLGAALGLPVDTQFPDDAFKLIERELLDRPKYARKTILIVWRQSKIPDLAKALGAKDAPRGWNDSVFDRVWVIDYDREGGVTFRNRPQRLMVNASPD